MHKQTKSHLRHGSVEARRARWSLAVPAVALACLAAAASAARAADDPPLDPDLQAILDGGMSGFRFALDCRSVAEDGSTIEHDEQLPVGGGRRIECETGSIPHLQAAEVQASTGERWCVLGEVAAVFGRAGEPSLTVSVTSTPDGAPWTLVGTVDGPEITIRRLTGLANWPLWTEIHYGVDVTGLAPNPDLLSCEDVFDL